MRTLIVLLLLTTVAFGQQPLPLTGWRAQIDQDLARVPMTREAHFTVMNLMQAYEKAEREKKEEEKK